MLTNRQKEIAFMLLNNEQPLLYRELAEKCFVSLRTIKSDMKEVKHWFKKHHVNLQSQPNKGVWVSTLNENEKVKIHHKLLMESADEEIWGEEGRIRRIILLLSLHPTKYVTAEFLADQLLVSKQTIYKDMKKVEKYLAENNLTLTVIPRKGYTINGEEVDIRQQAEYLLTYKIVIEESYKPEIYLKFKEELISFSATIKSMVALVDEVLRKAVNQLSMEKYKPTSVENFTLFVRLVISICRVTKEDAIELGNSNAEIDKSLSKFATFAYTVSNEVFEQSSIEITNDEFTYIYRNALLNNRHEDLIEITNNIIRYVSKKLSIPFYNDSTLQSNLLSHFSNKFTEENAILLENNPFMEDLKTKHDYLYHPVKKACEKYIQHNLPSEIISSFVTLHFLVSLETIFANNKPLKALYVCASGRGVARVVKNRVEREVPQIRVIQYCGLDDLEEVTDNYTFDLIISVFPIETTTPTVWVEPVPSERNIRELKKKVSELTGDNQLFLQQFTKMNEDNDNDDAEEYSREVILKAMELYLELKQEFQGRIKHKMEDAFLMHIFLMVHRIKFSMEYDHLVNASFIETNDYRTIDEIFKRQSLHANKDEKKAILFYIEKEDT
jgi:transcriptional antiterminator